ncbi:hypothetical protein RUM43_006354 [Polyplax serrata]|uniref:Uncharacterized protein n=1 Tax=Polyplax serrata TaxID=468196 RepID=A0AAN8S3I5_POLSC
MSEISLRIRHVLHRFFGEQKNMFFFRLEYSASLRESFQAFANQKAHGKRRTAIGFQLEKNLFCREPERNREKGSNGQVRKEKSGQVKVERERRGKRKAGRKNLEKNLQVRRVGASPRKVHVQNVSRRRSPSSRAFGSGTRAFGWNFPSSSRR